MTDFVALKTRLFTFKQLADELAINVLIRIKVALTKVKVSLKSNQVLTTESSGTSIGHACFCTWPRGLRPEVSAYSSSCSSLISI